MANNPPSSNTNLAAFAWEGNSSQYASYVGTDNQIYQLSFATYVPGQWQQTNVSAQCSLDSGVAPPAPLGGVIAPRAGCPLAGFSTEAEDTPFVIYIGVNGSNNQVQALVNTGRWGTLALNQLAKAPAPASDTRLAAYTWEKDKTQHVIYIDQQNHVIELYNVPGGGWDQGWGMTDISNNTGTTGVLGPLRGSPLVGYTFENQGTEHVVYLDQNNDVRELYFPNPQGRWATNNLSATNGAPPVMPGSPLAGYICEYENTQHVIYIGNDRRVHELYWSGGGWNHNNLSDRSGAPYPDGNSALAGYACEYEATQHVIYTANNEIYELYWSGGNWGTTDLCSSAGGATAPMSGTPLAGYAFEKEKTHHVFYVDQNVLVHELYRSGGAWHTGEVSK
jgi:hypothetical protein